MDGILLRDPKIDDEFKSIRKRHGQVGWRITVEDMPHVLGGLLVGVDDIVAQWRGRRD